MLISNSLCHCNACGHEWATATGDLRSVFCCQCGSMDVEETESAPIETGDYKDRPMDCHCYDCGHDWKGEQHPCPNCKGFNVGACVSRHAACIYMDFQ